MSLRLKHLLRRVLAGLAYSAVGAVVVGHAPPLFATACTGQRRGVPRPGRVRRVQRRVSVFSSSTSANTLAATSTDSAHCAASSGRVWNSVCMNGA